MKDRKLATRYARALLASLPDPNQSEIADRFLSLLRETLDESAEFRGIMFDPAIPRTVRKSVLRALAAENALPRQVGNFLATVVDHKRTTSLGSIARVFHEEREAHLGIVAASVTTPFPLNEDLKLRMQQTLQRITGREVRLTTEHDPTLIGGVVTRIGSKVYDGSLRNQLQQLRRKMIQE